MKLEDVLRNPWVRWGILERKGVKACAWKGLKAEEHVSSGEGLILTRSITTSVQCLVGWVKLPKNNLNGSKTRSNATLAFPQPAASSDRLQETPSGMDTRIASQARWMRSTDVFCFQKPPSKPP